MNEVLGWLLDGDSAMQHQTLRDLLDEDRPETRAAIASDGDAAALLAASNPDGHWGRGFYQPKWTCSHYTLLELRQLELPGSHPLPIATVELILSEKSADGGVSPSAAMKHSDVCINGMFLNYASWFGAPQSDLVSVIDFLLAEAMPDGGFNCQRHRSGSRTSSVHSTLSVLEGFTTYLAVGTRHRDDEVRRARDTAVECLLSRELFRRRGTTEPIRLEFTRLHHPARWHFDVLRALDALQAAGLPSTRGCPLPSTWFSRAAARTDDGPPAGATRARPTSTIPGPASPTAGSRCRRYEPCAPIPPGRDAEAPV